MRAFNARADATPHIGQRSGIAFGTVVTLKARHDDARRLETALDAAWSEIVKVQHAANLFDTTSALSRLNRDGELRDAPATLIDMLIAAQDVSRLTAGAFDVTVQPLWTLHQATYRTGRAPSSDEIAAVRDLIGYHNIAIDRRRVRLAKPGIQLTLNGIAQGYATERCLRALADHGITDAFLNTGEIGIAGKRDATHPWTAAIADPRHEGHAIALANPLSGVLATSGDYATAFTPNFSAHHIFDPKTLRSPTKLASVSVLAQSGAYADALATAMMVMEPDESLALAHRIAGIEVLLIDKQGAMMRSAGFPLA
ncbi:MAG: FAD:protein FMN transferase [Hyphomicrobium sp.]